jgi:hypothetical protein
MPSATSTALLAKASVDTNQTLEGGADTNFPEN